MKSYYTKKEREDRRARCIKYLLKYGNLPAARKAAAREGFTQNTSVWITALSRILTALSRILAEKAPC